MKFLTYAAIALIGLTTGCAGPRAFTKGTYQDPKTIALLDDRFNENDMQLIAKKVVNSILSAPLNRSEPAIMLGKMRNRTTEHIDMVALSGQNQNRIDPQRQSALCRCHQSQRHCQRIRIPTIGLRRSHTGQSTGQTDRLRPGPHGHTQRERARSGQRQTHLLQSHIPTDGPAHIGNHLDRRKRNPQSLQKAQHRIIIALKTWDY